MIDLDEYNELKRLADKLKAEADRTAGALDQLMGDLEKEYGCKTLAEAEAELERLERVAEKAEVAYNKELEKFKAAWGDKLEEID